MDPLDAFAPPSIRPRTAAAAPPPAPPRGPGLPPAAHARRRGRTAAVLSLVAGLAAVGAAALGSVRLFSAGPLVLVAVLVPAALGAGVVALVRSRARGSDVVLLSAGGAASALVAGVVAATTLLFPFGPPELGDLAASTEVDGPADGVPADLLAAMEGSAVPLGTTRQMEGGEVTVVDVRTDPADVAARLEDVDWLREDVEDFTDLVLVELEAPLEDGSWVPLLDRGDVSVVTPEGRDHHSWQAGRSASYDIATHLEAGSGGRGRGLVVVGLEMPHADARDALVVVTSPSLTDMATWETTPR